MSTIRCVTEQAGGYRHRIEVREHRLDTDVGTALGGDDTAPGAHDFFDASLAACKAHTAMWFARKNSIPLERVEVDVDRDATEERNGRYVLRVRLTFHGALTEEQRKRVYAAVAKCPVAKLMTTSEVVVETAP